MNMRLTLTGLTALAYQTGALAADTTAVSPTLNVLKMVMGLVVVLMVMVLIGWLMKRMLPNATGQNSAIKIVGGASVGSRERVVVLEVADRWLVVGVAQGQVSAIANLEAGSEQVAETVADNQQATSYPMVKPFSEWLQKSIKNTKTKS